MRIDFDAKNQQFLLFLIKYIRQEPLKDTYKGKYPIRRA